MYIDVQIYTYIHVYMFMPMLVRHIFIYVCKYIHIHIYTHNYIRPHTHIYKDTYKHIRTHLLFYSLSYMKKSSQVHRQNVCSEQKTDSELTTRATTPAALLAAVLHPYLQPVQIEGAREKRENEGWRGVGVVSILFGCTCASSPHRRRNPEKKKQIERVVTFSHK